MPMLYFRMTDNASFFGAKCFLSVRFLGIFIGLLILQFLSTGNLMIFDHCRRQERRTMVVNLLYPLLICANKLKLSPY